MDYRIIIIGITYPNIGYGSYSILYKNNTSREFYQIGISANTKGISIPIMGIPYKKILATKFCNSIGNATVTNYCIKFIAQLDINSSVLKQAIEFRLTLNN